MNISKYPLNAEVEAHLTFYGKRVAQFKSEIDKKLQEFYMLHYKKIEISAEELFAIVDRALYLSKTIVEFLGDEWFNAYHNANKMQDLETYKRRVEFEKNLPINQYIHPDEYEEFKKWKDSNK